MEKVDSMNNLTNKYKQITVSASKKRVQYRFLTFNMDSMKILGVSRGPWRGGEEELTLP